MNVGMQDAYNLAWKIGLVVNTKAPVSLLDSYHPERHRAGSDMLDLTDHLHRSLFPDERYQSIPAVVRRKLAAVLAGQDVMQQRSRRALAELNIGHHLVSRAIFGGLGHAVREMLGMMACYERWNPATEADS